MARHGKKNGFVFLSLLIFLILTGCQTSKVSDSAEISLTTPAVQPEETAVSTAIPTSPPPTSSATAVPATSTAMPPTEPAPEPTETIEPEPVETAVVNDLRPQNRQQLFAQLVEINNQAIDEATLLQALVEDQSIEEGEWRDLLGNSIASLEAINAQLVDVRPAQSGLQAYNQNAEALTQCLEIAQRLDEHVSTVGLESLAQFEPDLSTCIFGLDKMNAQLTRQEASNNGGGTTAVNLVGCDGVSTGFVPLPELGTGLYQGMMGGLYPDGLNERPATHEAMGLALADEIEPINGQIVLLSIGMSNTRNEFDFFIDAVNNDPTVNPAVLPVNGAIPGRPSQTIDSIEAQYWDLVDNRLFRAGVSAEDVQVIWVKQAHGYPKRPFPDDTLTFEAELRNIVQILPIKYPNLKQVFLSSRIYAGYATTNLSPEPYAYQAGFGVKWVIEDYLSGDIPNAPWLSWGPYLWGDGETPRQDGLIWTCDDFEKDGIHPATGGREKVAQLLLDFFKTDSVTQGWFLGESE
ncbi:MAG: hypothetical protein AAF490_19980 [Chloroflexota bacterium]